MTVMWLSISLLITLPVDIGYLWTAFIWINATLQVFITFAVLFFCGVKQVPNFVGYLYFASVLGMILDVVPEWLAEELACASVMLAFAGILYARKYSYKPITNKLLAIRRYLEREYNNLMKRPDYEFPSYFFLMVIVASILNICDTSTTMLYRQSYYTTMGMCCSTLISYKAVTSVFTRISNYVIQRCRHLSKVTSIETDSYTDKITSYQKYVIHLLLIDMLYLNFDPYQRGIIISKRLLFIVIFCIGHISTILVMYSFHDTVLQKNKSQLASMLFGLSAVCALTLLITYSSFSFMDIGILITLTNLVNHSLLMTSCAFGLFMFTLFEKEFVSSLTLTLLNTRVISAALVVIIDLCTLFFAFWMVLFGSYHKIELLCLFMVFMNIVCLRFLHEGLLKLGKITQEKISVTDQEKSR